MNVAHNVSHIDDIACVVLCWNGLLAYLSEGERIKAEVIPSICLFLSNLLLVYNLRSKNQINYFLQICLNLIHSLYLWFLTSHFNKPIPLILLYIPPARPLGPSKLDIQLQCVKFSLNPLIDISHESWAHLCMLLGWCQGLLLFFFAEEAKVVIWPLALEKLRENLSVQILLLPMLIVDFFKVKRY